jgi:hypothetical protein
LIPGRGAGDSQEETPMPQVSVEVYELNNNDNSFVISDLQASADDKPTPQKFLYTRDEAGWAIGVSVRSIDYLIENKQLATRRLGKKIMIEARELARFSRQDHFQLTKFGEQE